MTDQPQAGTISAAFPAPPPFYKSFTPQNLERLQEHLESSGQQPTSSPATQPITTPPLDLLSLPPELRNLIPPPPPPEGKYRSFGTLHDVSPTPASDDQQTPTPARLRSLTHNTLLAFLSLTNALATNPAGYAPIWDELHELFQEIHTVINGYRPHQARETLILMLEEQLERVRGETREVGEAVERAKEVVDTLGREDTSGEMDELGETVGQGGRKEQDLEKRIWTVLEREVGRQ